jgi:spore coat protein U-like protein
MLSAHLIALLALGFASTSALATTTTTTTFGVSATVLNSCLVSVSSNGVSFGNYAATAPSTATATISVTCTNLDGYNVGLNPGNSTGATVSTRKMTGPSGALLAYQLTSDSAHSVNWGQTIGSDTVTGTGNGSAQTLTVFGQIAAGQYVTAGSYTDTITATLTY